MKHHSRIQSTNEMGVSSIVADDYFTPSAGPCVDMYVVNSHTYHCRGEGWLGGGFIVKLIYKM